MIVKSHGLLRIDSHIYLPYPLRFIRVVEEVSYFFLPAKILEVTIITSDLVLLHYFR
jgi:hypothetical protein